MTLTLVTPSAVPAPRTLDDDRVRCAGCGARFPEAAVTTPWGCGDDADMCSGCLTEHAQSCWHCAVMDR